MKHLILVLYILIFAGGFSGLAALTVLALRVKSRVVFPFVLVQLAFLCGLALVALYFYLGNMLSPAGEPRTPLNSVIGLLSSAINLALYVLILHILRIALQASEKRKLLFRAAFFCVVLVIGLLLVSTILHLSGAVTLRKPLGIASYILIGITIPLFGLTLLRARLVGEHSAVRFLLRGIGICCLGFAPLGLIEYFLEHAGIQPYHPLSLDYLFFFGANTVMIIAGIRSLRQEASTAAILLSVSDDTAARFGLTSRERDMVLLIARGLSNKAIAWELSISPATVRTHIYNLYQKVSVQSRIELLNKLSG